MPKYTVIVIWMDGTVSVYHVEEWQRLVTPMLASDYDRIVRYTYVRDNSDLDCGTKKVYGLD